MTDLNQLITENLDIWTSAITKKSGRGKGGTISLYGIIKLRELLIGLAVQGKLLPQSLEDGNSHSEVSKIAADRQELVKAGEAKSLKKLPKLNEEELPYATPESWNWVRLQDVAEYIQRGKGPKYADAGSVQVISQKCVQWRRFELEKARFIDDGSLSTYGSERYLRSGDLLWNSTGTGTAGRVIALDLQGGARLVADSHVTVIRLMTDCPRFIVAYLASAGIQRRIEPTHENALVSGTTNQVELNTTAVTSLPVPFPPISEQHRIVAKLDELMELCDALEAQTGDDLKAHQILVETCLATLTNSHSPEDLAQNWTRLETHFDILFSTEESIERLRQTIYLLATQGKLVARDTNQASAEQLLLEVYERRQELLEAGYPNEKEAKTQIKKFKKQIVPDGLPELPPGWEWATLMQASLMVIDCKNKTAPYTEEGVRLIRTTNVRNGLLNEKDQKYVDEETFEAWSLRAKPEPGDLLITREAPMGEACLIPDGEQLCLGQRMMLARLVPDTVNKDYLLITFMSPDLMDRVQDKPLGMTVEHLRVGGVETLMVPVPPKVEQARIVERVHRLVALCEQVRLKVQTAQKLQTALADTLVGKAT